MFVTTLSDNMNENEVWLQATIQCLKMSPKPLHILEIKRLILEKGLIPAGLKTPLENALAKEIQRPHKRIRTIAGQDGVFAIVPDQEKLTRVATSKLTSDLLKHKDALTKQAQETASKHKLMDTAMKHKTSESKLKSSDSHIHKVPEAGRQKTHNVVAKHKSTSHSNKVSVHTRPQPGSGKYRKKYHMLRKNVRHMIFLNAAVCDEVLRMEEKVAKAKQERRFLLKRLMQHQNISSPTGPSLTKHSPTIVNTMSSPPTVKVPVMASPTTGTPLPGATGSGEKPKKKVVKKGQSSKDVSDTMRSKPRKSASKTASSGKRLVQPIPLDSAGRPVFPLVLGELTVHSIGEVVTDKSSYHCTESIYPAGYCSTRIYASMTDPNQRCLYTCKISDDGDLPKFEISPDDQPHIVMSGHDPSDCVRQLLVTVNMARGCEVVPPESAKGIQFFGLAHPCVQNLIQSCPGARKCSNYKWIKFEIAKPDQNMTYSEDDPSISFESLQRSVTYQQARVQGMLQASQAVTLNTDASSSLRCLLTSTGVVPTTPS